jgi:Zn-dependent protease/CBS domain-containing protein
VTATFRIGRVAGVDIGIHWSWLFIAILLCWSLAAGVFPETNPGLDDGVYVAMAAVAVPAFFACLLAHELGHARQARREGMVIEGIVLWLLGGVARFAGRFPSARAELRIALAGPAVSAVLGVLLIAVSVLVPLPAAVDGTVHWLGYINLLLLAFNLLPFMPLDGGRVLRAILWEIKGNFTSATRAAAGIARGAAQLMIFAGIFLAFAGAGLGGLWIALIGWFLLNAAEAEAADARARSALAGLRVADVMVRSPDSVDAAMPLDRFMAGIVLASRHTAYPVLRDGAPVGLVSFRNLPETAASWPSATVADRMLPLDQCLVVSPQAPLADVLPDLLSRPERRALVVEDGRLAGLLTATDVLRLAEVSELVAQSFGQMTARPASDPVRRAS